MASIINEVLDRDISGCSKNPKIVKIKKVEAKKLIPLNYRGIYIYVPCNASKKEVESIKADKLEYWSKVHGDDIERTRLEGKDKVIKFPKAKELKSGEVLEIQKPADISFTTFRERAKEYLRNYFSSAYKINYKDKQRAIIARKRGL